MSALSQTQLIFTHCRMKQVVKRSMQKKKESKRSKSHLFKKTSLMSPFSAQLSTKSSSEQFLEICRFFCSTRSLLLLSLWCYSCVKSERYDGKAGFNIVEFSQLLDWNSDCVTRLRIISDTEGGRLADQADLDEEKSGFWSLSEVESPSLPW